MIIIWPMVSGSSFIIFPLLYFPSDILTDVCSTPPIKWDAITLLNASGYVHAESLQFVEQHKPSQLAWIKRLCYCCCFCSCYRTARLDTQIFCLIIRVLFCPDISLFTWRNPCRWDAKCLVVVFQVVLLLVLGAYMSQHVGCFSVVL